ncbi:MAG: AAA family ATPase [Geminicoccaceae bacterium]|jgi:capsular exopolysaccharide synthesis family protein|nr:AAA family ATPase [Geminicoccaceae bacterium]HRY22777.1 AAA family ATPase [Geminicoccaceae bacterium]
MDVGRHDQSVAQADPVMHPSHAAHPAVGPPPEAGRELSLPELLAVLRRYRLLLAGALGVGLGMAVLLLAWLPPVYLATAQVMIEPMRQGPEDSALPAAGIADDGTAIDSQVKLLASRSMARQVIEAMGLETEPELQRSLDVAERLGDLAGVARAAAREDDAIGLIDRFLERLEVARDGKTHVIRITFRSSDPGVAAQVANGVAERYIAGQLEAKARATRDAADWLRTALDSSREVLEVAESELASFRENVQDDYADAFALHGVDVVNLRRDLVAVAGERAARQSELGRLRRVLAENNSDLAFQELGGSEVLEDLYNLKNQTTRREAELATQYGDRHPLILDVRAERRELERRIRAEQLALVGSVEAEIAAARAREAALQRELEGLKSQNSALAQAEARIADLERAADRARRLHEAYLARYQAVADAGDTQRPDARLISEATVPPRPSQPRPALIFSLFGAASLGTGLLLVFFLEQLDHGFRSVRALEQGLGLRCLGAVPLVDRRRRRGLALADLPLERPRSRFAESLRALIAGLVGPAVEGAGRVVLVTSSVPGEGKSTTTTALARLAAAEGLKVLLIDADLRRPILATLLGLEGETGLVEILRGEREAEAVLRVDRRSGLSFIPGSARVSQPTRLLGPAAMGILLDEARRHFDLVLVDSPPLLAVGDARVMAPLCDAVLLLVRWNATQQALATHALSQLGQAPGRPVLAVLTGVDPDAQLGLGSGESRVVRRQLLRYYAEG